MNKQTVLHVMSLSVKVISFAGGLAIYADKLPVSWVPIFALVFAGASILKDTVNRIGDLIDDGVENNSFK